MPQIAIRPPGPPIRVEQDDVAVIELNPQAVQDDSVYEPAGADIQDEQPGNQDEHPDFRQASVVSRMDGPAAPYVALSDDSEDEGDLFRFTFQSLSLLSDFSDAETVVIVNNDVANVEDVANEDDLSASLEEAAFPLDLAIEEIKSMSVSIPQIITID